MFCILEKGELCYIVEVKEIVKGWGLGWGM